MSILSRRTSSPARWSLLLALALGGTASMASASPPAGRPRTLKVEVPGGMELNDAIERVHELASARTAAARKMNPEGLTVETTFGGTALVAHHGETLKQVRERWQWE